MGPLDSLQDGGDERELRRRAHTSHWGSFTTLEPEDSVTKPFDENGI